MGRSRKNQQGIALLLALLATVVILGAVTAVVMRVHTAKRMTDNAEVEMRLDEVCKAGVEMGLEQIWHQYVIGNGNTTGNLASYKVFIEGIVANGDDVDENGLPDAEFAVTQTRDSPFPTRWVQAGLASPTSPSRVWTICRE